LFAGLSFSADRCSSARSNCAVAAARLESEDFVVSEVFAFAAKKPMGRKVAHAPRDKSNAALRRKNNAFLPENIAAPARETRALNPRDPKTGESRAKLIWTILDRAPMRNLKPRPDCTERVNARD
jgi:hypothetical protein